MCLSSLIHTLTALQISLTAEKTHLFFFSFQITKKYYCHLVANMFYNTMPANAIYIPLLKKLQSLKLYTLFKNIYIFLSLIQTFMHIQSK